MSTSDTFYNFNLKFSTNNFVLFSLFVNCKFLIFRWYTYNILGRYLIVILYHYKVIYYRNLNVLKKKFYIAN